MKLAADPIVTPSSTKSSMAPASGARPAGSSVQCNAVDALLQNVPVPVTFTFEERLDPAPLLASLERALAHFPLFSGRLRLTRDDLYIECKNQGISSSVVDLREDFIATLERLAAGHVDEICEMVQPRKALKGRAPLLTVRFNQPTDRGTILGVCWHHSVGDMSTFMSFMLAWAAENRGEAFVAPEIVPDRHTTFLNAIGERGSASPGIRRLGAFDLLRFVGYLAFSAKKQEIAGFYFADAELEALRADLSAQAGKKLSRNDALCAHLASIIFPLDPVSRPHTLALAIDWRARLGLSPQLIGNFIGGILVQVDEKADAATLASRIRSNVDRSLEDHLNYVPSHQLLEKHGGFSGASRFVPLGIDPLRGTLLITNWTRFGVNSLEFQGKQCSAFGAGGRPPFPWLSSIFEGPSDRGLIYSVSLPTGMGKALKTRENLQRVHKYRPKDDVVPEEIRRVSSWL